MHSYKFEKFEEKKKRLKEKNVLFVATKNIDYLRIVQEKKFLKKYAKSLEIIESEKKGYFTRIFEVLWKLLLCNIKKYDLIFVGFQPQFVIPFFNWKFKNKEIWVDFFISLYDTLVFDRKKIKDKSFFANVARRLDQYTVDKSNLVICDTAAHGTYFCDEFCITIRKVNVFYLAADESIYYPQEVIKPEKYRDKFVVFYFGSIHPLQGVEIILRAAEILEKEKKVHFIVVGPIANKVVRKELDNITYVQWLPQDKLAEYIAFSDLCLAGHFNCEINKAKRTIPGKAYIYDAMNKKIVLGDSPANHELFEEDEKHYFVKMGSGEQLSELILRISNE